MEVAQAYEHCVDVTRSRARNFYFGIRLLPAERRRALCAVYALARRIDDIGDGALSAAAKIEALKRERAALGDLGSWTRDPVLVAVGDATSRYPIPLDAFEDLIAGVEMDVQAVAYHRFDELLLYCRRVAGTIGRLCLGVFETRDRDAATPLADDLGVALQLTNILRDVREDLAMGRVYLPSEDLRAFLIGPRLEGPPDALAELVAFEARRAAGWFDRGLTLVPLLDRASAACVGTMAGIYRSLLERIEAEPQRVLTEHLSLTSFEKGWLGARSLAGLTRRRAGRTRVRRAGSRKGAWS